MRALLVLAYAALTAGAAAAPSSAPVSGILLLAHGGDRSWNAEVESLAARVGRDMPVEVAFGMADPAAMQAALDRLAARGVSRAAAVPLFVHSRSEVMDQTRYALGLAEKPSEALRAGLERMAAAMKEAHGAHAAHAHHAHAFSLERVKAPFPVALTRALDEDPLVSAILLERARALSRAPKTETVVLVAHGPTDPAAVADWDRSLAALASAVKRGGFRAVETAMLRDDAEPSVRAAAVAALRAKVAAGAKGGRALVVPVLLARGGIEHKLAGDLAGLDYAWDGRTLMPHEGFEEWVRKRARAAFDRAR